MLLEKAKMDDELSKFKTSPEQKNEISLSTTNIERTRSKISSRVFQKQSTMINIPNNIKADLEPFKELAKSLISLNKRLESVPTIITDHYETDLHKLIPCEFSVNLMLNDEILGSPKQAFIGKIKNDKIVISVENMKALFSSLISFNKSIIVNRIQTNDIIVRPLEGLLGIEMKNYLIIPKKSALTGLLCGLALYFNSERHDGFNKTDEIMGYLILYINTLVEKYYIEKTLHDYEKGKVKNLYPQITELLSCVFIYVCYKIENYWRIYGNLNKTISKNRQMRTSTHFFL